MKHPISFSKMTFDSKIESGDPIWGKFTASFINKELEVIDIANDIYMGHPFTTWHKNQWRDSKNFIKGGHIGIDFDTADIRSSIDYLRKDDFIRRYASLIYTTPSHTPEKPKGRVLFLLEQPIQQSSNYIKAVMSLLWLFSGLTTPDEKCKDSCRFFYGSKNCEIELFDNTLPIDLIKYLIGKHESSGQSQKRIIEQTQYIPSSADEHEIADALKSIPAWGIDYAEWRNVLMGIHSHLGESGLSLAESWGQGKDGEIRRLWRHFKPEGNNTGKVTIKSLFKIAYRHGWQGPAKVQ